MARPAGHGMNSSTSSPRHVGRLDEVRPSCEKMLTWTDHLGLCAVEISHTGEQPASYSRAFIHLSLIGAAFGLGHALG